MLIKNIYKESLFLYHSSRKRGLINTLIMIYNEKIFDIKYKTKTTGIIELNSLKIGSENRGNGVRYEATNSLIFKNIFQKLARNFKNSVFVDFGAGKGRAIMMASDYYFKLLIGVEFSFELCQMAEQNIKKYSKKQQREINYKIINSDAVDFKIPNEADVFYFFNPFDEKIMNIIVDNIEASVKLCRRDILIIYINAIHKRVFETRGFKTLFFIENPIYREHGAVVYKY
jgi:predicted RNA methylase